MAKSKPPYPIQRITVTIPNTSEAKKKLDAFIKEMKDRETLKTLKRQYEK